MKREEFLSALAGGTALVGCSGSGVPLPGDDASALLSQRSRRPSSDPSPSPTQTPSSARTSSKGLAWGVTLDNVNGASAAQLSPVVAMLSALPVRPWSRFVVDNGSSAATSNYSAAVSAIAPVSSIMLEICDSWYVKGTSFSTYKQITSSFLAAFPNLDLWEVGNELNGEWLGGTPYTSATGLNNPVVAKAYNAWKLVAEAGKQSALTLYYEPSQTVTPGYAMVPWAQANFASLPDMASGLNKVLISYYETDNQNIRPTLAQWTILFQSLHAIFPKAALGFGEVGMANPATSSTLSRAKSIMSYYYALAPSVSNWWGGFFWWYGQEDLVPDSQPLFALLKSLV
jgi:hypothetical protein